MVGFCTIILSFMILCPVQGMNARDLLNRQNLFGANPHLYKRLKLNGRQLKGHEGIDIIVPVGTQLFAPIEGTVRVINTGRKGYGLHIEITSDRFKVVLAHLSRVFVKSGGYVGFGDSIGMSGDSGNSTGPHVHLTVFRMKSGKILDLDNGYGGAVDVTKWVTVWEGTLTSEMVI